MFAKIASFWEDFTDLIFPKVCCACNLTLKGTEYLLCTDCLLSLPRIDPDGMLGRQVAEKFIGYREVKSVRAFLEFHPRSKVQRLLHKLKYRGREEVGVFMGKLCAQAFSPEIKADLLVPVPLHPRKQKERGYNQSAAFARGFSEISGVPVDAGLLRREKYTLTQTGKSKFERVAGMQGVFTVRPGVDPDSLEIVLMDDVLTTGATLEACVAALVEKGCRNLHIITIAAAHS